MTNILKGASPSQQRAYESAMKGDNIFLTGEAGSGKSWLIQKIIEAKQKEGKRVLPEAPTGIAAINLQDGTTMHRTHGIPIEIAEVISKKPQAPRVLYCADVLIIDEISMARIDVFEYAMKTVEKTKRKMQIIVVGDFCQLPPVATSKDKELYEYLTGKPLGRGYCFQSPYWKKLNFKVHYLKEAQRQSDIEFLHALNQARYADPQCISYFNKRVGLQPEKNREYVYLTGRNKVAEDINREELNKINAEMVRMNTDITGKVSKSEMRVPEVLNLKVGARVMLLLNDAGGQYSNGTMGTVKSIAEDKGIVYVELKKDVVVGIQKHTWEINKYVVEDNDLKKEVIGTYTNYPIRLAWAITIHKSQGQTFDSVILDPCCWETGQLYVALSRVRDIKGLILTKPISKNNLKADQDVEQFYKDFNWQNDIPEEDCEIFPNINKDRIITRINGDLSMLYVEGMTDAVLNALPNDPLTTQLLAHVFFRYHFKSLPEAEVLGMIQKQKERAYYLKTH